MAEQVLAAVRTGPGRTELREFPMPDIPDDGALLKVEVAGRQGVREGDRVFVEHYVGCFQCDWCRAGEYRHCELTDWRTNPDARRFGYTSAENPYHLWGGFAQYMFL